MDEAAGNVDDSVRAALEDADLGRRGSSTHGEPRAMPKRRSPSAHDTRSSDTGVTAQRRDYIERSRGHAILFETRTAGARRTVGADEGRL